MAQRGQDQQLEVAYKLLAAECPSAQIRALLQAGKKLDRDGVRVKASNKADLIDNLKKAVGRGIPASKVFALVQESEENGSQHIFYYQPRNAKAAASHRDPTVVAKAIFKKSDLSALGFPVFRASPEDYDWSDFRSLGKDSWLAKMYGREEIEVREGEPERDGNRISYVYEFKPRRTVLVAKRHSDGLIEIRVPRIETAELVASMRDRLKELLEPVIDWDEHIWWDLSQAKNRIKAEESRNKHLYTTGTISLKEINGHTWKIIPPFNGEDEDEPEGSTEKEHAAKQIIGKGGSCDVVVVQWKPDKAGLIPKGLRTVIGSNRAEAPTNEIIVTRKTSSVAVDYVADQLRHFTS